MIYLYKDFKCHTTQMFPSQFIDPVIADLKTFFTNEIEPHEGSYVAVDEIKKRFLAKYKNHSNNHQNLIEQAVSTAINDVFHKPTSILCTTDDAVYMHNVMTSDKCCNKCGVACIRIDNVLQNLGFKINASNAPLFASHLHICEADKIQIFENNKFKETLTLAKRIEMLEARMNAMDAAVMF